MHKNITQFLKTAKLALEGDELKDAMFRYNIGDDHLFTISEEGIEGNVIEVLGLMQPFAFAQIAFPLGEKLYHYNLPLEFLDFGSPHALRKTYKTVILTNIKGEA